MSDEFESFLWLLLITHLITHHLFYDSLAVQFRQFAERRAQAAKEVEANHQPDCNKAVLHQYLLPLRVCATIVAYRHLVNRHFQLCDLGRDFHFKSEAAGNDQHVANDLATKRLITGFNVGHVQVSQRIGKKRQKLVGEVVIEIENTRCSPDQKTGTKDNISVAIENRPNKTENVRRVIFEVGVLHDDDLSGSECETGLQGRGLAGIALVTNEAYLLIHLGMLTRLFFGSIS